MSVERISIAAVRRQWKAQHKKPHKYRAKAVVVDGCRFASQAEAAEYSRLLVCWSRGIISDLELQPVFELHAPNGERIGRYVADFRFKTREGDVVVVDVKGMKTLPLARWKQRHLMAEYGIAIQEVRRQ